MKDKKDFLNTQRLRFKQKNLANLPLKLWY